MRLRKNMKRTAAAVLALSMAVSAVAAPASAAYICDVSQGNVEVSVDTEGNKSIKVGGVAVEKSEDESDDIVITGDNTKPTPTESLNAEEENTSEVEKSGENASEVEKSGETKTEGEGEDDEPTTQELLAPEDEEKKDEQKETDQKKDEQKPAETQETEQDKKTEKTSDQVIEYGQYDPEAQQEATKPAAKPAAEQKAEEKKAAAEVSYEATNAPTSLTEKVQEAARNVVKIINDSKEPLKVILRKLKVDAGDTAQNAMTIKGKGNVTLELDGKTELTGGSGTFKDIYGNDQKGYGIDSRSNSLTVKGNKDSSLTANGGAGGGLGIHVYGFELDNADVTANGGSGSASGIYVGGNVDDPVSIKNSKLTATGGSGEATGDKNVNGGTGIYSTTHIVIGEGSEVVGTGGNAKSENGAAQGGGGIGYWQGSYEVKKGGKLTAIGGDAESKNGEATGGNALWGAYMNSTVFSGETTLIAGNAKSGSGKATGGDTIKDGGYGMYVTVNGGTTTVVGGKAESASGPATNGNGITNELVIDNQGGKIEEAENAKVDKKEDGTVEVVVGDVVSVVTGDHKYKLTATVQPTCTTPGKRVYTCTTWGHTDETYEETIDALGHHFTERMEVVAPTYTSEGYTIYKCANCGETEKREFVPMLVPESNGGSSAVTLTVTGAGAYETSMADGRYIIAVPAENAVLSGCLSNLKELKAQGVNTLVFRTQLRETALNIDSMLSLGVDDTLFTLTHSGESAELTVGGFAHNELLN